ncbi:iron-containing alcohol dehydrogenase [Calidifontibacter terrae]
MTGAADRPGLAKFQAPEVVFGSGSIAEAGFAAARLGARRPYVVTDPGIVEAGWADRLIGLLRESGLDPQLWTDVTQNPKDTEVRAAYAHYREQEADVIIGIGGGSAMDAAKGVAVLAGNGGDILDFRGVDRMSHPLPPSLMIPTTAGTGADVSQFCIVTDTARSVKVTIMGRTLVPDISITDPDLLVTMPPWLSAATGLDALTHGVESYVSLAHNPIADLHALAAVDGVCTHLTAMYARPRDPESGSGMAQASLNAGLAFSNAILGATHAMSHQVGGLLDLPHGVINGILLPHVIRFNAGAAPERFVRLAQAAGLDNARTSGQESAELLAVRVEELGHDLGVPPGLAALGVTRANCATMARTAMQDACVTTNPRPATQQQLQDLFEAAL